MTQGQVQALANQCLDGGITHKSDMVFCYLLLEDPSHPHRKKVHELQFLIAIEGVINWDQVLVYFISAEKIESVFTGILTLLLPVLI